MKKTQEMFVHMNKYTEGQYCIFNFDISGEGYVLVGKQAIEFEVPDDFDPTPVKIAMLKAEEKKVREEFTKRIDQIKEEIGKLQALTYEVSA